MFWLQASCIYCDYGVYCWLCLQQQAVFTHNMANNIPPMLYCRQVLTFVWALLFIDLINVFCILIFECVRQCYTLCCNYWINYCCFECYLMLLQHLDNIAHKTSILGIKPNVLRALSKGYCRTQYWWHHVVWWENRPYLKL